MTLTFVTNLVHHHQLPVADEFYKLLGEKYRYIATQPLPDWLIKGGYDPTLDRPYIIRSYESHGNMLKARRLIDESDVVIHGAAPIEWSINRQQDNKVTFFYSERWLKTLNYRTFSPSRLRFIYKNYYTFRKNRSYMLCASAFTADDVRLFGCFPSKCFKWGYITKVDCEFEVEAPKQGASTSEITPLMWCARFLKLKHPELPVKLAVKLKEKGYKFVLDMYGSGEELESTKKLISELGVHDCVNLCGNHPNDEILQEMRKHKIFLFTSDRNEGWGAVLNESMANGCAPVASDAIGSVPYLIKDGHNGLIFQSCNVKSLEKSVRQLLDNPNMLYSMRKESVYTMQKIWSPKVASSNFVELAQYALENRLEEYKRMEGPASWHI